LRVKASSGHAPTQITRGTPLTNPSPLRIQSRETRAGVFEIALAGRLDADSADRLEDALAPILAGSPRALQLNLAGVSYISSRGLGVVISTIKRLHAHGGKFAMTELQPPVRKVFEIAAALPEESVFASPEEADRYFDAIQRKVGGGE
ncbi:MAG TPA: STAS domain-containing protein, partial [Thermoanaerobaculia bacterium]|nr:STAS domain-containing protein [Thermoanaerobaculia bacterium]